MTDEHEQIAWLPDLIYTNGRFEADIALVCNADEKVTRLAHRNEIDCKVVRLKNRALLPGMVNAHSHAFQRVIRGKTEYRFHGSKDSFWTWRELMYSAAQRLGPEDIYDASRMAFLEMALGGITAVGEFHYLHRDPNGNPYDDPNLLAKEVIRAAQDVGIRIALLRVAYARSGFHVEANERQKRFIESDPNAYLKNYDQLKRDLSLAEEVKRAWVGIAPHSIRAVPLEYLRSIVQQAESEQAQVHMHVAEQPAENEACVAEHGKTVVELLAGENILNQRFTCVHCIHITKKEANEIASSRANVCACPTTERNLGDGVVPADILFGLDVNVTLGSDSQTQIDLLEDARQLEYNLRLTKLERNVLTPKSQVSSEQNRSVLAARLLDCATKNGAASIDSRTGILASGYPADFFTIDLNHPSLAGSTTEDLLSNTIFSMPPSAVRDVFVGGRQVIDDGKHLVQQEIIEKFVTMQKKLWEQ